VDGLFDAVVALDVGVHLLQPGVGDRQPCRVVAAGQQQPGVWMRSNQFLAQVKTAGIVMHGASAQHRKVLAWSSSQSTCSRAGYWRLLWKTSVLYSCISLLAEPRGAIEGESSMRRSKSL
jgi:hypothetical protein